MKIEWIPSRVAASLSESESPIMTLLAGEASLKSRMPAGKDRRIWLPAVALLLIVWTVVEGVDLCAVGANVLLQPIVKSVHIGGRVVAERDPALIAHHDDPPARTMERGKGRLRSRKKMEVAPRADVRAFGSLRLITPSRSRKTVRIPEEEKVTGSTLSAQNQECSG